MKARNLASIPQFFNPREALSGQHLNTWYVQRPATPRNRLRIALVNQREPQKVLFVGHRGSGKSTELNKLAEEVNESFHTIGFNALDVVGRSSMRYEDLMLTLATQITRRCIDDNLVGRPRAEPLREGWQGVADWWRRVVAGIDFPSAAGEISTSATLSTLLGEIEIGISQSSFTRDQLNDLVDRQMPELIRQLNWVIGEAERHLNPRRLLVIVEGLDKVDLEAARNIFRDHATTITALHASMVYTFPLALRYSQDYRTVQRHFNTDLYLHNLAVRRDDGADDHEGMATLREIVLKRLEPQLIAAEALSQIAQASGGLPSDLIRLVNAAAIYALERSDAALAVEPGDAQNAIRDLRRELAATLSMAEWKLLKQCHANRLLTNEPEIQQLLYKGALVEYSNSRQWCDVHPLLWSLLDYYAEMAA